MGGSNGEEYWPMGGDSGWMAARGGGVALLLMFFFMVASREIRFLEMSKITE